MTPEIEEVIDAKLAPITHRQDQLELAIVELVIASGARSRVFPGTVLSRMFARGEALLTDRAQQDEIRKARATLARLERTAG